MSALTATIDSVIYPVRNLSVQLSDKVDARSTVRLTIYDATGSYSFRFGQPVQIADSVEGIKFTGFIHKSTETKIPANVGKYHALDCMDNHFLADSLTSNEQFSGQYAGIIAVYLAKKYLAAKGVAVACALQLHTTAAELATGNLTNTAATANGLELAPAGSTLNLGISPTQNIFVLSDTATNYGTYIGCATTKALAFSASCTIPGAGNAYLYISIARDVGYVIDTFDQFTYEMWIPKSSKMIKAGIDIVCTDGITTLRDIGTVFDQQYLSPHPNTDLKGWENQWYARTFNIGFSNLADKTIDFISISFEGDDTGDYSVYFRRIQIVNGGSVQLDILNDTSQATPDIPRVISRSSYTNETIAIVDAYESSCLINSQLLPLGPAGIYRSSNASWVADLPPGCNIKITGSMDATASRGATVFELLGNNVPMPGLVPGMDLAALYANFFIYLYNNGDVPTVTPKFSSFNLLVSPSYAAAKSDVRYKEKLSSSDYVGTLTNLTTQNDILSITGYQHKLALNLPSVTLYGNGTPGYQLFNRSLRLTCNRNSGAPTDCKLLINSAGNWQNFIVEADMQFAAANIQVGFFFCTTHYGNGNDTYGYTAVISTTGVVLGKGSNSSSGSNGSFTSIATQSLTLSANSLYHLKVQKSGTTFDVWLNDVHYIVAATDSSYNISGGIGFRVFNNTGADGAIAYLQNFGVVAALSGTYVTPAIDIHSVGTVLAAFTRTQAAGDLSQATLKTEVSLNNGSTWADCAGIQAATQDNTAFNYLAEAISGLAPGTNVSAITQAKLRLTLSVSNASAHLETHGTIFYVLGPSYVASGTRISPLLSLAPAGRAGSTLAAYNATVPANTSVALATSTDGTSFTNVANGGQIAGIAAQPTATLDTFDRNSSSTYTSTSRTGGSLGAWVWDVLNSCLLVSAGTNAQLLYSSLSCKDSDIILDLDQADCAGLIWRAQDASNFYELDIFDGSSSAGATNALKLYKVVANAKTQLGSTAIVALTRGTKYRVRVVMIGSAITISVDGVAAITLTDSALAGPGKIGVSEVSGAGRFYNLRIQPQGDDLSNVRAYHRLTLTTTDPTATPQIVDATLAALGPSIGLGKLISTADYRKTFLSANFDDLTKRSDSYYWLIDQFLEFIFSDRVAIPAPWILQSSDQLLLLDGPLSVERSGDLYRNRMTVKGVLDANGGTTGFVSVDNTNLPGTITQKDFARIMARSTGVQIVLNQPSTAQTVSGDFGDLDVSLCAQIAVDVNLTAITGTTPTIQFFLDRKGADGIYYPIWQSSVVSSPGQIKAAIGAFAATNQSLGATVRLRYALGGTGASVTFSASVLGRLTVQSADLGVVEVVEDVSSLNLDVAAATAYCLAALQRYGSIGRTLTFKTRRSNPSLGIGQYLPVSLPEHNLHDASLLIVSVDATQKIVADGSGGMTQQYTQSVTASENANIGSVWKLLASTIQ